MYASMGAFILVVASSCYVGRFRDSDPISTCSGSGKSGSLIVIFVVDEFVVFGVGHGWISLKVEAEVRQK